MSKTILLVRHGFSEGNHLGCFTGNYDVPLTETGRKQAELTAKFIVENYNVGEIYSSSLKRAMETAKAVGDLLNLPVNPCDGLREISGGKWEAVLFDDLKVKYADDYSVWMNDLVNSRCTGGESIRELAERVINTIKDIAENSSSDCILVVCHATPIRIMQCIFEGKPIEEINNMSWVPNSSVSEVKYENGSFTMKKIGMDSHLEGFKTALPDNI